MGGEGLRKVLTGILFVMIVFGVLLMTACEKKTDIAPEDQKSWNDVFVRMKEFKEQITRVASPSDYQETQVITVLNLETPFHLLSPDSQERQ